MRNKKSQGLSLNVIVIAAIVLIVLVVIWFIFTGKMKSFSEETEKCPGGVRSKIPCDKEAGYASYPSKEGYCCIKIGAGKSAEREAPEGVQ